MHYTVYTNNSALRAHLREFPSQNCKLIWLEAPAVEVLTTVKALIHQGAALGSDPLSGVQVVSSNKVASNPYISVLVTSTSKAETVDFNSVKSIDEALTVYRKNAKLRFFPHNDEAVRKFQITDMEMLLYSLSSL